MTGEFTPLALYTLPEAKPEILAALDLNDAATSNAVADAIVRFVGGGHVIFSDRYPWHRTKYDREHPEHYDLYRRLIADPQQHEHVIDVQADGAWTMRHPLEERLHDLLFECKVADRVHDLGIDAMPDPGVYVVQVGDGHVDFLVAA